MFTVPSGGGGVYYFSASFLVSESEFARFYLRHNDDVTCEWATAACSVVISVSEGM